MKIDFYYWNYMCPLNYEMIELLKGYRPQIEIFFHDITDNRRLAREMRMFYPTLTVINDTYRHYSPINKQFLDSLCSGIIPQDIPYTPKLGENERTGAIVPITADNYHIAGCCIGKSCLESCQKKFLSPIYGNMSIYGFMNVDNGQLLGGAEYIPSMLVPYDIPHDMETAFITCVYLSDGQYDYKSPCLRALEEYLSDEYKKIIVISDEIGVFPNGDLNFFIRNGYEDLGIIAREEGYCTLHIMNKIVK